MKLMINGRDWTIPEHCTTVGLLLEEPEWQGRLLIVELNGTVVFRDAFSSATLKEGDRIELVQVVGGG